MHTLTPPIQLQHLASPMSLHAMQVARMLGNEAKIAKIMGARDSGRAATDRAVMAPMTRTQDPGMPTVVVG